MKGFTAIAKIARFLLSWHPRQAAGEFCSARAQCVGTRLPIRKKRMQGLRFCIVEFQMTALWCHTLIFIFNLAIARGLHLEHLRVTATHACQLIVSSFLCNPAILQD